MIRHDSNSPRARPTQNLRVVEADAMLQTEKQQHMALSADAMKLQDELARLERVKTREEQRHSKQVELKANEAKRAQEESGKLKRDKARLEKDLTQMKKELNALSERVREDHVEKEQMETYKRDNKHLAETLFSLMAVLEEKEGEGGEVDAASTA